MTELKPMPPPLLGLINPVTQIGTIKIGEGCVAAYIKIGDFSAIYGKENFVELIKLMQDVHLNMSTGGKHDA